jgi:hypothetical protein
LKYEHDNKALVEYLFGGLPEPEQARIEELCFTDNSLYEQLSAVENDLIDKYVQNTLTEPERRDFEEKYLITPQRRKRVAESEKIINLIINYPSDSPKAPWWSALPAFLEQRRPFLLYSLAAMVLLLMFGSLWLIRDRARLNKQFEQTQVTLRDKESELQRKDEESRKAAEKRQEDVRNEQAQRERDEQLYRELQEKTQQAQGTRPSNDKEIRQNNENQPSKVSVAVATYVFPLVSVRGGQSERQLVIRRGQKLARLTIYLRNNSYQKYNVSVQRVSGEEIWSHVVPRGRSAPGGVQVSFELPASVFEKKDYILSVDAAKPDGATENLDTRSFSVSNENIRRE